MRTLERVYELNNLNRAWLWVRSNPDAAYKDFFRGLYTNYAVTDTELLGDLRDRLKRDVYEPAAACKIFLPKPSGLLRPLTLLTVEDQIIYSGLDQRGRRATTPRIKHRYNKEVFGHLLAGNSSTWFYKKWQDSYARFNQVARRAFDEGFVYAARFDLTAFYDSLDDGVLCHFLKGLTTKTFSICWCGASTSGPPRKAASTTTTASPKGL